MQMSRCNKPHLKNKRIQDLKLKMPITNINSIDSSPTAQKQAQDAKLMDSCKQFEGQFLNMMLQEMRKTVPEDTLLGDSDHQQEIFQGMMDDKVSQDMAKSGQGGDLATEMYKQLSLKLDAASAAGKAMLPSAASSAADEAKSLIPLLKLPGLGADNKDHDDN
jgi:peptidoglycan hydrolase FlgJ